MSKRWREQIDVKLFGDLLKLGPLYYYFLESEPLSPDDIVVNIRHVKIINGEVLPEYQRTYDFKGFNYELARGKPRVAVDLQKLCKSIEQEGVKEEMEIEITVAYVEK